MGVDAPNAGSFVSPTDPNAVGRIPHASPGRPRKPRVSKSRKANEAIAQFVDLNSHKLQEWLAAIEEKDGPKAAFICFMQMVDYHVPKLSRRELTGADERPVELRVTWAGGE